MKTMLMQNFRGLPKSIMGNSKIANYVSFLSEEQTSCRLFLSRSSAMGSPETYKKNILRNLRYFRFPIANDELEIFKLIFFKIHKL